MTKSVYVQMMSDTQRQFIAAAESMGATSPAGARVGAELPRISARELVELLDTGIVREAAQGSYYVYPRAPRPLVPLEATPSGRKVAARRRVKLLVLVIVVLIVPLILRLLGGAP